MDTKTTEVLPVIEFPIIKLSVTEQELIAKAEKYKNLFISGADDKNWYDMVQTARKDLKNTRVSVEKFSKAYRDPANKFAKDVMPEENRQISIIKQ